MESHAFRNLLTGAQMRALEEEAIACGLASGLELMERAGRGVVGSILARWPGMAQAPSRAIVLCGPGNNGGDGFVIARLLKGSGWEVELFLLGDRAGLPPDAARNHDRWCDIGLVKPLPMTAGPDLRGGEGVIVDALFGIGLSRGLGPDLVAGVFAPLDDPAYRDWHRVAVDIPSGLCADAGRVLSDVTGQGAAFRADLTVTFHRPKPGHVLDVGPDYCGSVVVCDIGLGRQAAQGHEGLPLVGPPDAALIGKRAGHKYEHGHALVLSGGLGRSGAARLAARAALRIGAGLVSVAAPQDAMAECAAQLTAVMLREAADAPGFAALLTDPRLSALCLGPGLGIDRARSLVPVALASGRRVVLDADALSAHAEAPGAIFAALHPGVVLTPHDGEFARLFPDLAAPLGQASPVGPAYSRVDAVRAAAARAGATVLLKGRDTIIADPSGRCAVHAATGARAAPWLATAGSGDVLAGMITGLMARGLRPFEAAQAATWLHVEAAHAFGPGLIAEDLPETLPVVLRELCGRSPS